MNAFPSMLPRLIRRETPLIQAGKCTVEIIYPHHDPAYARLADCLAELIGQYADDFPVTIPDDRVIPERWTPLPEPYRRRSLILLGNLNNNRLISPLYARYYCATDAIYPGGDGCDLHTLVNPYGTGTNFLLAGGSSLAGVEKAVKRLSSIIQLHSQPGELSLPYLMEVELAPPLAKLLAEWPDALLKAPPPETADLPMYRAIGAYTLAYAWTGDDRYGLYA